MTRNPFKHCLIVALTFLVFHISGLEAKEPTVSDIRIGATRGITKFVIDLDTKVDYNHILLADPYRIVIDLPNVNWGMDTNTGRGKGRGLITGFRYGQFQRNVSRIVIDLKEAAHVRKIYSLPPSGAYGYRIVLDMEKTTRANFLAEMKGNVITTPEPVQARTEIVPQRKRGDKRVIVIDAGHGGVDPGAPSVVGVPEKRITLDMAKAIRDELQRTGRYRVILTRDRDIYITHRNRFQVARRAAADLFISVHGDSLNDSRVRGATVYSLSERASDQEAAALARRENKSDLLSGVNLTNEPEDVTKILIDLAQRETMNYSARFANYLVPELKKNVRVRKNPHRFASLLVLKAPDVPSILLEMGYLTNRDDARMLTSGDGRKRIARSVRSAIDNYFSALSQEGY